MKYLIVLVPILLFSLMLTPVSFAQDDPIDSAYIDIYDESASEFLDLEIVHWLKEAGAAYSDGDYESAAMYYIKYLERDINNSTAIYNLACCYGLLGEADLAGKCLFRAFITGFENTDFIEIDTDFDNVRGEDGFDRALIGIEAYKDTYWLDTERIFLPAEAYLPCHVRYPSDYRDGETRTLVIGLHDSISSAYFFSSVYDLFVEPDFIMANVNAPYGGHYDRFILYNWDSWKEYQEELPSDVMRMSTDYVESSIASLKYMYDADRVILLGFGAGAAMAYRAGLENPGLVDGIIAFAGKVDTDFIDVDTLDRGNSIPVFIGYSELYGAVPHDGSHAARELLEDHGYRVTFYEITDDTYLPTEALQEAQRWIDELE